MQFKNSKYIIGFFILAFITWACKKGIDDSTLEKYKSGANATVVDSLSIYLSGAVKSIDKNTLVSFDKQSVAFKFSFSEEVSWNINIIGSESGASKKITGMSFGADTASVKWYGEADGLYYFSKNDTCKIEVIVLGSNISLKNNFILVREARLDSTFLLVADFEPYAKKGSVGAAKFCQSNQIPQNGKTQPLVTEWNKYFDTENKNEEICGGFVFNNDTCGINDNCGDHASIIQPINGVGYFHLHGQDYADEPNNYYIGGFNHDPVLYGINPSKTLEEIWVNFYATNLGKTATNLKVKFYGIGGDQFSREFSIDWTGWKLVSVRLSDLALEIAGPNAPGKLIPAQLKRMGFEMLCNRGAGSGCEGEVAIDYVTITYDKPFNPNSVNK